MPADLEARAYDVLVVGAGPAGLAAAWAASQGNSRVGLVDENSTRGGQIWRGGAKHGGAAVEWIGRVSGSSVEVIPGARVIGQPCPGVLAAETLEGRIDLAYRRLILAPGARERFLPFPGWTLPNVCGAGGLQALAKSGLSVADKSVVVAGTGPLLLAVAAYLRSAGADVRLIAEQAPRSRVLRFGLGLAASPAKLFQAVRLRVGLGTVPYRTGCWPVAAEGATRLESVTLTDGWSTWTVPCDYLACGFDLVPNAELPRGLGCETRGGGVVVNEWQESSVAGLYCAGEVTGIGGLDKSLIEGQIAGHASVGRRDEARVLFAARARSQKFAESLARTFALRDELKALAKADTIVCRCEDVSMAQLAPYDSIRDAKLQTRCGMGPCQGRVCGSALAFLRGWPADSARPPVFPARLGSLVGPDSAGTH